MLMCLDPLSPANFPLLSRNVDPSKSAALLLHLAEGLRYYGLDYCDNETADRGELRGSSSSSYVFRYRLDPALIPLTHFENGVSEEPVFPARECDAVLHRLFLKLRSLSPGTFADVKSSTVASSKSPKKRKAGAKNAASDSTKEKTTQAPVAVLRDFFGRPVEPAVIPESYGSLVVRRDAMKEANPTDPRLLSLEQLLEREKTALDSAPPPLPPPSIVRFKFNAGFTNAVRRTVYVGDFVK